MGPLKDSQARILPKRAPPKPVNNLHPFEDEGFASDIDLEPPSKRQRLAQNSLGRQKWIPGGRGGGGRHIDCNGTAGELQHTRSKDGYFEQKASRSRQDTAAAGQPVRTSSRRTMPRPQPRYSTATAAAAAVDGYKPREERGWEEFHPDLDLESDLAVIPSEQVDGRTLPPSRSQSNQGDQKDDINNRGDVLVAQRPPLVRRRPGRPPRRADSMLNGLHMPDQPRIVPPPGPNPRERLTLPRPSFKEHDAFLHYEQKDLAQVNFVDRSMAAVGYQESEVFVRPEHTLIRLMEGAAEEDLDLIPALNNQGENAAIGSTGVGRVEYDMDEQDAKWLDMLNRARKREQVEPIKPAIFEITMTKIEKEWHALEKRIPRNDPKPPQTQRPRSSSAAAVNGEPGQGEEQDSKCSICDDGDCENANAIVFCDGCDLAVHQECYGVPYIPDGQWLCRKCLLLGRGTPTCIFCPNTEGAFKQTNSAKWAHILCAYWIPEASIGNMSLMEPIVDIEKVPYSRWRLTCFICQQKMGACIQCSHRNCYQAFHVTCARRAKMYLRMKAGQGVNSLMDKSQLKALCDKHVPAEWRLEHDTERSTTEAKKYYLQTMKNRKWADSQASALAIGPPQPEASSDNAVSTPKLVLTHGSNKRSKAQQAVWRLSSGAPVIPDVICKSIEASLQRFNVRKKKDYVAEVCKYWTLKREARRGAPLLKRLQLQMDSFSSGDVTRRDYVAQGAAGRSRLERRIEFGERLLQDLGRLREITELIKEREALKLADATMLRDLVDATYFPIPPMLAPILNKALQYVGAQESSLMISANMCI
jgi:NuA3 HAT complex component NTO1